MDNIDHQPVISGTSPVFHESLRWKAQAKVRKQTKQTTLNLLLNWYQKINCLRNLKVAKYGLIFKGLETGSTAGNREFKLPAGHKDNTLKPGVVFSFFCCWITPESISKLLGKDAAGVV